MTGFLPLAIRVDNRPITREVSAVQFRKEAIGGLKSISLRLFRPLDRFDTSLAALSSVYLYDGRSAETIGEGRLTDFGRSAGADGQVWDLVAFGPGAHATDITRPLIYGYQSLVWFSRSSFSTKNATVGGDERDEETPSLMITAEEGKTVTTSWRGVMSSRVVREAGMKLARVRAEWDSGVTDANYSVQLLTTTGDGALTVAATASSNTAGGVLAGVVVTNFTNGHDVAYVRSARITAGTTGAEAQWFEFYNVRLRSLLLSATGTEITTGYTQNYVLAHEIVNDLLGRVLDLFDGASSTVDTGGTHQILQFAYPDGVTAEQVLNDLMLLEPAYRWWAEPGKGGGYIFHWEPWPTTVRYEVTLEDGGDFPASTQELFNKVMVRYRGPNGRVRQVTRTGACPILDDAGIIRQAVLDLGDEVGDTANAIRAGDNFLAEHRVPKNAGTLNINRPIRDLWTGRMVEPFEIEEAHLIRVRGIESYPDALNASSSDGLTVFRIWTMTYNSDSTSAALELDTDARTVTNALRQQAERRPRKR